MSTRAKLAAAAALALALLTSAATPSLAGPAPIWDGLYLGGHVGWADGTDDHSCQGCTTLSFNTQGITAGGHIGYNFMVGSVLLGVEGDISWSDANGIAKQTFGTTQLTFTATNNYLASIRGRIGLPVQNLLFYATAGVAWTEWELNQKIVDPNFAENDTWSNVMVGYVVGGGIEAKLTQNFSGRIEGLYYAFEGPFSTWNQTTAEIARDVTVVRAGLSYHFN